MHSHTKSSLKFILAIHNLLPSVESQNLSYENKGIRKMVQALRLNIHQFLVSFFQRDDCIPKSSNLTEIFNAISVAKLWHYDHYGPPK